MLEQVVPSCFNLRLSILYKYLSPKAAFRFLRTRKLTASNPLRFNDPFEVRPYFDQERHDHFAASHEAFYSKMGLGPSLLEKGSMVGLPTDRVIGFSDELNRRFREDIGRKFRVLCLCRNYHNPAMWGHYADSFRGIVVGIDASHRQFPPGLKAGGFKVEYTTDRSRTRLPLAYYEAPAIERLNMRGEIVNNPHEEVVSDGGLVIPFHVYRENVECAYIRALTTKAPCWQYEREVRFIYDLRHPQSRLRISKNYHFVPLANGMVRELIVGFRAQKRLVARIAAAASTPFLKSAKLHYTWCHPNKYRVLPEFASPDELDGRIRGD